MPISTYLNSVTLDAAPRINVTDRDGGVGGGGAGMLDTVVGWDGAGMAANPSCTRLI